MMAEAPLDARGSFAAVERHGVADYGLPAATDYPSSRRRPAPRRRPAQARPHLGHPSGDGVPRGLRQPDKPLLPSQKRLLKAMGNRGLMGDGHVGSGNKRSPPQPARPPGAMGSGPEPSWLPSTQAAPGSPSPFPGAHGSFAFDDDPGYEPTWTARTAQFLLPPSRFHFGRRSGMKSGEECQQIDRADRPPLARFVPLEGAQGRDRRLSPRRPGQGTNRPVRARPTGVVRGGGGTEGIHDSTTTYVVGPGFAPPVGGAPLDVAAMQSSRFIQWQLQQEKQRLQHAAGVGTPSPPPPPPPPKAGAKDGSPPTRAGAGREETVAGGRFFSASVPEQSVADRVAADTQAAAAEAAQLSAKMNMRMAAARRCPLGPPSNLPAWVFLCERVR